MIAKTLPLGLSTLHDHGNPGRTGAAHAAAARLSYLTQNLSRTKIQPRNHAAGDTPNLPRMSS
jgi:hypothetical protein